MTIDWFTVGAQLINFLVLVFLLQRFLYGPIVRTIEERKQQVADRMQEAEEARRQAQEEEEAYRRKQNELAEERDARLAELHEEIEAQRKELMQQVRNETQETRHEWKQALRRDEEQFMRRLRMQISDEFFTLARHALSDLADAELERQAVQAFLRRIEDPEGDTWSAFREATEQNGEVIVVRSAFELSGDVRKEIEDALEKTAERELHLQFETDAEMIAGIELQSRGQIAAWQVDSYLDAVQMRAQSVLEDQYREDNESESDED